MALVDKKGRLFGLINIIDLGVILLVLLVAAGAYAKFGGEPKGNKSDLANLQPIEVTFLIPEVLDFVGDSFQVGDSIKDSVSGNLLGEILAVRAEPFGEPGRYNVILTVAANGQVTDSGIIVAGEKLLIGNMMIFESHLSKARGAIIDVKAQ